MKNYTHLAFWL